MRPYLHSAAILAAMTLAGNALAEDARTHWVTSWYAAPQPGWDSQFVLPMNVPAVLDNQTVREYVRVSAGGERIKLVFSNRYGKAPLAIGAASVVMPEVTRVVTFEGARQVTIAAGATVTSDPVALAVAPLSQLEVTTYLPQRTPVTGFHWGASQRISIAAGNASRAAEFLKARRVEGRLFLSAVLVDALPGSRTVVALGDSITDGNGSTPDADRRWPDFLARRLAPHGIAVANAGISGARLLKDGMGEGALARFGQDVLSQSGVSDVIVLLGINDIGWPGSPFAPAETMVTLNELTAGFRQLAAIAHARTIRITVGTLPPFEGALEGTPFAGHYNPQKEALRLGLNDWIRGAGIFDGVVDFDAVLRDPARPQRMRVQFDSGDHLHPGDAGYRKMADAIDIDAIVARDSGARRDAAAAPSQ
ncbi:SGNH/GDSL hydrolase family protein [Oxalobacteraceae sp. CFBP 8763]|nr:SGNH/GDSL hydrolase family protein [Oxalobacteraceae sp. CFBP 8763]